MPGSFSLESQYYLWIPYGSPPLSSTLICGSATLHPYASNETSKARTLVRRVTCGPRICQRNSDTPIPTHKDAGETRWTYSLRTRIAARYVLARLDHRKKGRRGAKLPAESQADGQNQRLLRGLRDVAATLMRRRHRARVEDIAMPAEKTLGLSEQLARRPGKRCQDAQLFHFRFAE